MGQVKRYLEENEINELLELLVDNGHLEGSALGITKQVIDRGVNSLSSKQKYVFENKVLKNYVIESCSICGGGISWSEMYQAIENEGICGYCEHKLSKDG
ncbi:hypothetical protein [Myxosarcina sp. GI1]|uniref:hypothetical protein n=1 Tax=Myxosarcina sp. GI1 TaxID=1541065 RepID=UPI00055FF20C|nr:hypothetical protein [Myxosarcina sp. GI1]